MISEFQNLIQISTLCCLAAMAFGRAIVLKFQKTKVVVLDPQITKRQLINGVFFFTSLSIWILESFSYGLSLNRYISLTELDKLIVQHEAFKTVGIIALACGLAVYATALVSFRKSWRIGIDRENPGDLVTTGIFRYSRNPIYISLDLLTLGTFLLQGRITFLVLFICIALSLHIQILHEEKFLIQTYGDAYLHYQSSVGRYFKFKFSRR